MKELQELQEVDTLFHMVLKVTLPTAMASSVSDWNKKSKTGFVGLSNQSATCYMNSLIQTLFTSPEFRTGLYKWNCEFTYQKYLQNYREKCIQNPPKDKDGNVLPIKTDEELRKEWERDSIPRQLQLLFGRLELRDQRAIKTKVIPIF